MNLALKIIELLAENKSLVECSAMTMHVDGSHLLTIKTKPPLPHYVGATGGAAGPAGASGGAGK